MNRTKTVAAVIAVTLLSSCAPTAAQPQAGTAAVTTEQTTLQTTTAETQTESAAAETVSESSAHSERPSAEKAKLHKLDIDDNLYDITLLSDRLICAKKYYTYEAGSYVELNIIDINTGEVVLIPLPEKIGVDSISRGNGDVLCKTTSGEYEYAGGDTFETEEDYAVTGFKADMAVVKTDYSFDVKKDCSMSDIAFDFNGHSLCEWAESIYEVTPEGEKVLVKGVPLEDMSSKRGQCASFVCEIDNNRFAYLITGYEWLVGFGMYDFTTGESVVFPDTDEMYPIGAYNGKVYSFDSPYASECNGRLYVTDTDTKVTSLLIDYDIDTTHEIADFTMSGDGSRIAITVRNHCYNTNELWIADSADGHITARYDISDADTYAQVYFTDNDTLFICADGCYTLKLD